MKIDLLAPEVRANPYPVYEYLRREKPAAEIAEGMWALSRAEDIVAALKDTKTFSNAGFRATVAPDWMDDNLVSETLFLMDPPQHGKYRQVLGRAFGKKLTTRMADAARRSAEQVCSTLPVGRPFDFVAEFSQAYVSRVMAELLDLDDTVRAKLHDYTVAQVLITPARLETERELWVKEQVLEMQDHLASVLAEQRRKRSNPLLVEIIDARISGEPLTDDEIIGFLALLVGAGLETTVNAFSNSMIELSARPETLQALLSNPDLIAAFAAEILRYDPPTHALLRLTTRPVSIRGTTIPKDALVMLLTASAHRDPKFCADGDRFRLDRTTTTHMAFGHGAHICLGASLATMELNTGLRALLSRFNHINTPVAPAELEWNQHLAARGPLHLPVILEQ